MSYAYPRNTGGSSLPSYAPSSHFSELDDPWESVPSLAKRWIAEKVSAWRRELSFEGHDSRSLARLVLRKILTVPNAVIIIWIYTLWWGERTVFQESTNACLWESWERWPQGATPHHVAFIADPQLVDPHTYPDRPWPLSTLTVKYTDQYMRRSFNSIQRDLGPDTVLFLGDLFNGGREWATDTSVSPEERYKDIDDSFWKKEYTRFMKIFLDPWVQGNEPPVDGRGRKLLASLPGNHDLGFGYGIQEPVRRRFQSYFGPSNRVDVIGNHTFVSVDTPSLSAMDQPDPKTGSSTPPAEMEFQPSPVWKDADDFLNNMPAHRAKAETEELRFLKHLSDATTKFNHRIADATDAVIHDTAEPTSVPFPTILLTHVPLYRKPGTPCGPLREKYPPSSPGDLEEDERNALTVAGGYQYQNVLTPSISTGLVSRAGPNIAQVYSGDDHDYCEVVHREFNGSPNEITVKSLSWAMGVRQPGFLLTSLWNPIDPETGQSQSSSPTIQNHLCLLPDQLDIFIHYAYLFGLSVTILVINSVYRSCFTPQPSDSYDSLLPLSEQRSPAPTHQYQTSGTSSSTIAAAGLASRGGLSALPRTSSAKPSHDAYWGTARADYASSSKDKDRIVLASTASPKRWGLCLKKFLAPSYLLLRWSLLFISF
ncbi:hypothetical protein N7470_001562 [Penicillium chermesinum]|nr:hypothetical protein N7470_001562 [Penicillium chermesinum]